MGMNRSRRGAEGRRMEDVLGPFTIDQAIFYGIGHEAGRAGDAAALASMQARLASVIRLIMWLGVTSDTPDVKQLELAGYVPGREEAYGCTAAELFSADLVREQEGLLSWVAGYLDDRGVGASTKLDKRAVGVGLGGADLAPHRRRGVTPDVGGGPVLARSGGSAP